ncbi:hypothetical protein [Dolichospermum sp. UHCC 0259]|uniref:hypothetical protein n=1 Tax=Dolichospermum sp. UHCC 0259 TaxID=2590010 RepID=UPI0014461DF9|nr:hypothetical protein [Dolichospermum sp. UHCC 0259]MTJ50433.1 hypothetical protein [Dolichospermum sp. UHCC 0259]
MDAIQSRAQTLRPYEICDWPTVSHSSAYRYKITNNVFIVLACKIVEGLSEPDKSYPTDDIEGEYKMNNESYYKVGGPLSEKDRSYVKRQADNDIINLVKKGEHCYILNSNQTGKTSLLQHTSKKLQEEFACIITRAISF